MLTKELSWMKIAVENQADYKILDQHFKINVKTLVINGESKTSLDCRPVTTKSEKNSPN